MAQVTQAAQIREWADDYLSYLSRVWEGLPKVLAEWPEWDNDSRLTFVVNWGVPEDRLAQLQRWAEQGLLTPAQCTRFEALAELIEEHRPLLERLLKDEP